ncbi:MAG TPA: DUF4390 domain-containing protein [Bordetella sp.]
MTPRACPSLTISRGFWAFLLAIFLFGVSAGQVAQAADPRIERIDPSVHEGRLEIDADVRFDLNDQLRNAAQRGVPLFFTADLVITRSRWWWFDHTVVNTSMTWRIVYNALTRQWRAGAGELSLPVASLDEAMDVVRHIRNWQVSTTEKFDSDTQYAGQLRVRLDTSMLTRPFQVNALNSTSWSPATPWTDFSFALARPEK